MNIGFQQKNRKQRQVFKPAVCNIASDRFCALENVHVDDIILYAFEQYHVFVRDVRAVIDNKHDFFRGLRRHAGYFIAGKLPEICPYRQFHAALPYQMEWRLGKN